MVIETLVRKQMTRKRGPRNLLWCSWAYINPILSLKALIWYWLFNVSESLWHALQDLKGKLLMHNVFWSFYIYWCVWWYITVYFSHLVMSTKFQDTMVVSMTCYKGAFHWPGVLAVEWFIAECLNYLVNPLCLTCV